MEEMVEWFDANVMEVMGRISKMTLVEDYSELEELSQEESPETLKLRQRVSLPFRCGGLGLRSHRRILHVPFLAATGQIMGALKHRVRCLEDPDWLEESWIGQELKAASGELRKVQTTAPLLPREGVSFIDHYCDRPHRHLRLQRQLTKRVEEAAGRQWHERYPAADREKLRQQSMELPGAKDVFTVIPEDTNWGLPIRGSAWRAAIAGWLGLPHGKLVVRECQGKHQSCRRHGAEWDHHQSCVQINGKAKKTRRHDGVVNSLAWCLRSGLGLNPQVEPNNLDNVGRRRPDILVSLGEKQYLVDVAVVQSFGAGQVETGRVGAKYLEAAERRKREHYADIAVEFQAEVVPFVVDASGVWGPSATKWVSEVLNKAAEEGFIREDDVGQERRRIRFAVAHALHKGNSAMWHEYSHKNATAPRQQSLYFTGW